ncbi:hypothetical protein AX14_009644 [Amanita brunnescens Koide BX004]|nr:hypothetical protein AX14_009644 [Amanita brunnescens Koide BX004]
MDFISIDSYSPKKGSSLFKAWCSDLALSISELHSSGRPVIYTDGAFWNKTARGSFSFTCYQQGIWRDFYNWCPAGSSFDAEIAAIEQAIQWACVQNLANPVFLIDNKAALTSFLDTRVRSSHMATIRINSILLDHFTSPDHTTFTFRYCPSHSGLEGNDRADRLTKLGAALAPDTPPRLLLSNFVNDHTKRLTAQWQLLSSLPTFKGRQWMPIRHKKKRFLPAIRNKARANFFHDLSGNDITLLSRMARAATNHAPTGEYRRRFYPGLDDRCPACPDRTLSRTHILFHCPRYVSLHSSMTNWCRDRNNSKSWKAFFSRNPSAFTFGDLPDDVH